MLPSSKFARSALRGPPTGEIGLVSQHSFYRLNHTVYLLFGAGSLHSRFTRFSSQLVIEEHRNEQDRHMTLIVNFPGRLQSIHVGHFEIKQHHIGMELLEARHRLAPATRLTADLPLIVLFQ